MKIVFDFGGVLFRWKPLEFLPRLLPGRATSAQATQELARGIFQGFDGDWGQFDRGVLEAEPLAQRIAARTGLQVHEVRRVIDAIPLRCVMKFKSSGKSHELSANSIGDFCFTSTSLR